ncbi:MAG: 2-C-methyl-D-erythritol 2,4-cyclodiphosphate synthase [Candidatus Omnitrophota bacterium]|nr:2-C-methyl-D-erythritol 2,4-cyclodiphosphate synthase [Candidatus Omnitrophota bacterium]MDZ4241546.1 2-C-methyl-D-erythritol 2,4-cyclodiphosphate synthase [Candidatus Omnitrophota bacterium]
MSQRVGIGYDAHRFVKGRKLFLGGVEIPYGMGLAGHSDADVLIHAICDAILGAMGKGDIGEHFPNTDFRFKNISSLKLLKSVFDVMKKERYNINNVDAVVVAEEPNLKAFKKIMCSRIARELSIKETAVNIKATTNEGMGFAGRKEGVSAYATVLLKKTRS